jgi:hypothetical protein
MSGGGAAGGAGGMAGHSPQPFGRHALEVVAAGRHHLLMVFCFVSSNYPQ